jgi:hypothetical protein
MWIVFIQGEKKTFNEYIQNLFLTNKTIEVSILAPELIQNPTIYIQPDEKKLDITIKLKKDDYSIFPFLNIIDSNLEISDIPIINKNIVLKSPGYDAILDILSECYPDLDKESLIKLFVVETKESIFSNFYPLAHQIDYDDKFDKQCLICKLKIRLEDTQKLMFFVKWVEIITLLSKSKK